MFQVNAITPTTLKVLNKLMAHPSLSDFALAGGTALALRFGHRISVDLDLFSPKDFSAETLLQELREDFEVDIQNVSKNTLNLLMNGIKVDILVYKYPQLEAIDTIDTIRLFSIPDIAAMKLSAVSSRGSKKDFYDLYFLLKQFPLPMLLNFYQKKYQTEQYYHILKSLIFFDDAETEPEPRLLQKALSWDEIKIEFEKVVRAFVKQDDK